ncbi:hypothetical protein BB560_002008 [Smittium megazygosporum]|uniref:Uncharacterized protein n=1 Tax=Smittium megazygosporum TaxID=133381 RepID=A0A2T9ZFZ4_9FUNG|nr:hypothetical protein BB560_002008 [Smittium megazygosporum]
MTNHKHRKRPDRFTDIGVKGRKTGAKLEGEVLTDNQGFENIDEFYSKSKIDPKERRKSEIEAERQAAFELLKLQHNTPPSSHRSPSFIEFSPTAFFIKTTPIPSPTPSPKFQNPAAPSPSVESVPQSNTQPAAQQDVDSEPSAFVPAISFSSQDIDTTQQLVKRSNSNISDKVPNSVTRKSFKKLPKSRAKRRITVADLNRFSPLFTSKSLDSIKSSTENNPLFNIDKSPSKTLVNNASPPPSLTSGELEEDNSSSNLTSKSNTNESVSFAKSNTGSPTNNDNSNQPQTPQAAIQKHTFMQDWASIQEQLVADSPLDNNPTSPSYQNLISPENSSHKTNVVYSPTVSLSTNKKLPEVEKNSNDISSAPEAAKGDVSTNNKPVSPSESAENRNIFIGIKVVSEEVTITNGSPQSTSKSANNITENLIKLGQNFENINSSLNQANDENKVQGKVIQDDNVESITLNDINEENRNSQNNFDDGQLSSKDETHFEDNFRLDDAYDSPNDDFEQNNESFDTQNQSISEGSSMQLCSANELNLDEKEQKPSQNPSQKTKRQPRKQSNRRQENSDSESGALNNRKSSRVKFKPLDYWRNERVNFVLEKTTDGDYVPSIKNVIRVESENTKPRRKKRTRVTMPRNLDYLLDKELKQKPFDAVANVIDFHSERPVKETVAISAASARSRLQSIQAPDSNEIGFSRASIFADYTKLGKAFLRSGLIEIPSGGVKPQRNTKSNSFVFYVAHGTVEVKIHNATIELESGSHFCVPRGNYYSITNNGPATARLFYTSSECYD